MIWYNWPKIPRILFIAVNIADEQVKPGANAASLIFWAVNLQ